MEKYLNEISVDEARCIQIEILNELDSFCKLNNIKYFIIAGTLLGAVRHKGYIPWDDDIDVVMLRKDYEEFSKIYKSITNSFYLADVNRVKGYTLPFMKLCKSGTISYELPRVLKCDLGINIDIFPIDNVPNDSIKQNDLLKINNRYKYWLGIKWGIASNRKSVFAKLVRKILYLIFSIIPYKAIIEKMNLNAARYNCDNTDMCSETIWGCGKREFVNRSVFSDSVDMVFEGNMYQAPVGWDEWLRNRYGDYMKLPPLELQKSHHNRKDYVQKK